MLHTHILTVEQKELIRLLKHFRRKFYLVAGTAIALQIGHRRSIDFDLFSGTKIDRTEIKKKLSEKCKHPKHFIYQDENQLHLYIKSVKFTFFHFPYSIPASIDYEGCIKMPSLSVTEKTIKDFLTEISLSSL